MSQRPLSQRAAPAHTPVQCEVGGRFPGSWVGLADRSLGVRRCWSWAASNLAGPSGSWPPSPRPRAGRRALHAPSPSVSQPAGRAGGGRGHTTRLLEEEKPFQRFSALDCVKVRHLDTGVYTGGGARTCEGRVDPLLERPPGRQDQTGVEGRAVLELRDLFASREQQPEVLHLHVRAQRGTPASSLEHHRLRATRLGGHDCGTAGRRAHWVAGHTGWHCYWGPHSRE